MAVGEGVFSEKEIDDFLSRMTERARRAGKEDPTLSEREALAKAAGELTREELKRSLVDKRLEVKTRIAWYEANKRLELMPGDEADKLIAYDVGSERQGPYTSASVDAEGRARTMSLWGKVEIGLRQADGLINRISNFWGFAEKDVDEKIAAEMARINGDGSIEPTNDEGALHAARVFVSALEEARLMQNAQGAWIGKREGYIVRQSHDRLKIAGGFWRELAEVGRRIPKEGLAGFDWQAARLAAAKRAFRAWRDVQLRLLDPKTFDGLELEDVPLEKLEDEAQAERQLARQRGLKEAFGLAARGVIDNPASLEERMLFHAWFDIVTGRHEELSGATDAGDYRPPAGKARSISRERVFVYRDPKAWIEYNRQFGTGSLFQSVMGQLERAGKNAALMQRYGPNPDAMRARLIESLANEARERGDPGAVTKLHAARTTAYFEAVNGRLSVPENLRLAMVIRGIRNWEVITKLGGVVLSKATDLPLVGHSFARAGAGFFAGYEGALKGILHLESDAAKRAGDLLDVGARAFAGHIGGQYNAGDGALGWGSWASRLMYRINLFEFVNEGSKRGAAQMLSAHLGAEAAHPWAELQAGTRETFERFGIDEKAWDLARAGVWKGDDGRAYFTLEALDAIADKDLHNWLGLEKKARTSAAAQAARADLDLRFRTMIHNIVDDTTSDPRAREMTDIAGGLKAGTIWGEAARSFGQFRSFAQTVLGRHLLPAARGYAGYAPAALLAHFIVATTLAGWLSMNAKLIARGQVPRSVIGADVSETARIWLASLAQGGGLGIYGDYLFGSQNRQGLEFSIAALAGPAISDMEQVAQVVRQAVHGGAISETTGRSQIPGELVRIGKNNVPLVNLWYTRLALDYLVLWRLQEAVSPGYLQRYENQVRGEGGDFIVPPTAAQ